MIAQKVTGRNMLCFFFSVFSFQMINYRLPLDSLFFSFSLVTNLVPPAAGAGIFHVHLISYANDENFWKTR